MLDEKNSKPESPASKTGYQDSTNESIHSNTAPVATGGKAEINDRTGLYISIIALAFAAMAFGAALIVPSVYEARMQNLSDRVVAAERAVLQLREDIRVMGHALARHGVNADEHAIEKGDGK